MDRPAQDGQIEPVCPHCGEELQIIAAKVQECPGIGKIAVSYCGNLKCRKLLSSNVLVNTPKIRLPGDPC